MAKDYTQLAEQLLRAVGGKNNIANVVHCATRLRFNLKDNKMADAESTKRISGVITVVEKAGQFQVVIGNTVPEVYKAVLQAGGLENMTASDEKKGGNPVSLLIDTIAGIFPPLLGVMCGAGLIKGLLGILAATHLLTPDMNTYMILNAMGDTLFYFLPVLLGFSAGRKFGGNPYLTAVVGATLIYPSIIAVGGTTITFLKIPLVVMNYSSSVIPILVAAYLCCRLEKVINRGLPSAVKNFLTPFFCLLITMPLTFLVIGPICTWLGNTLANGYSFIYNLSPIIGGAFVGAFWQVLVIFGLHWGFIPVMINNIAALGFDTLGPVAQVGAMSQTGAAFGMMMKMKNKETKGLTFSSVIAGIFGITEPIVYGVTLPRKKPFIMGAIAGAVGGGVAGLIGAKAYAVGALGVFAIPATIGPDGFDNGFWGQIIGMLVAFVVAAALNYITYKDDTVISEEISTKSNDQKATIASRETKSIYSPMKGEAHPLSRSNDPVHAQETLGKGVLIVPKEGKVYAPFDGEVAIVYDTKHALGLISDDGVELLIHIGMDTVRLDGKYFNAHVSGGEKISKGDLLLEFDMDSIRSEGYELESPIIVSNTPDYEQVIQISKDTVSDGDRLIDVEKVVWTAV